MYLKFDFNDTEQTKNVGNYSEAEKYLLPVLEITPVDEIDEAQIAEAQQLLADIEECNIQVINFFFLSKIY